MPIIKTLPCMRGRESKRDSKGRGRKREGGGESQ